MKILIAGDLVPTQENIRAFSDGRVEELLGGALCSRWQAADYRAFNLECAVTDSSERLLKNGPALVVPAEVLNGIRAMAPSVLFLANNHIMDAGEAALAGFLDAMEGSGLTGIGAGRNAAEADRSFILRDGGCSVGIYACCDREFSGAGESRPGANVFTPACFQAVHRLAQETDHVIVIFHGGKEYYRYPSPETQTVCRSFAEAGARLVLCQHSHCIGALEEYAGCTILYGQGNFLFNKKRDPYWHSALVAEIDTEPSFTVRWLPIVQTEAGTALAEETEAAEILKGLRERSGEIGAPGFTERSFAKFAASLLPSYLYAFAGWNKYLAAFDRKVLKGFLIRRRYNRKKLAAVWNFITSEAQREAAAAGIANRLGR